MFMNYFEINQDYIRKNNSLETELIKANARIEELTNLTNRQADTIIDLCVTNSSAELITTEMENQKFEIVKWQNKYVDLVNRSLDEVSVLGNVIDDKIEAGEEVEKESLNTKIPWHVRRRQLEMEDRKKANELKAAAEYALANKPPSIEVLTQAAKELEAEFADGE